MKRREFVARTAAAGALLPLLPHLPLLPGGPGEAGGSPIRVRPFDVARVRLGLGPFRDALQVNRRFLLAQEPDRLLHTFRVTAGLPSTAPPLGGLGAPQHEPRGPYTGHYLSAPGPGSRRLGDQEIRTPGAQSAG